MERAERLAPPALDSGVARWTLVASILGSSMAFIDGSVVNVALPSIQRDLGGAIVAPLTLTLLADALRRRRRRAAHLRVLRPSEWHRTDSLRADRPAKDQFHQCLPG